MLISMRTSQGKIEHCSVAELALLCSKAASNIYDAHTCRSPTFGVRAHVNIKVMFGFYPGLQYHG